MKTTTTTASPDPDSLARLVRWQPIKTAPRNASDVEVRMRDGTIQIAHWASDLSGEEQPPFEGWFVNRKTYNLGIPEPMAWRPCSPNTLVRHGDLTQPSKPAGCSPLPARNC